MEALAVKTKRDPSILNADGTIKTNFEYQDVLEIATLPLPQCTQPNDVLIQVAYSDVNPVDLQRLQNNIRNPKKVDVRLYARDGNPDTPFITGYGGTGIVEQVGDEAPRHLIGKSVCFLADPTSPGSYATHVVTDARSVAVMPPSLAQTHLREAATIPVAGLTAYESLAKVGLASDAFLKEGGASLDKVGAVIGGVKSAASSSNASSKHECKSLLIVGGSGGVGSWCITLARAWNPHLEIHATASTEHEAWCYQLGASKVYGHDPDYVTRTCLEGRDPKDGSVDAIICLTEPTPKLFKVLADVIKPYGTICLVVSGDSIQKMDLSFCFFKCVNIATQTVFSSMRTNFQIIHPQDELDVILQLLTAQKIKVPLSPLLQENNGISEKFKDVLLENGILAMLGQKTGRKYCGKLVLCINSDSNVIFVDCKTASLVSLPRVDCIAQNIVPWEKSKNGLEGWKDAAHGAERDCLIKILKEHQTLGILPPIEKTTVEITLMESENIKNLWGVSLKKRERNKKGEEVIFLDPRTETLVELSRTDLIAKKVLSVDKNEVGKEMIQENVTDPSDRDDIVNAIRKAIHLLGD